MKASIILPTYGARLAYLEDTLASLQEQEGLDQEIEILTVDNGPSGKVAEVVERRNKTGKHPVIFLRESEPGVVAARHTAARHAKGDVLIFVDDDVLFSAGWLRAILKPYSDPKVGASGGAVQLQYEGPVPAWLGHFQKVVHSFLDMGPVTKELVRPNCPWSCNLSVRRSVLFEVGGFNPGIFGDPKLRWYTGDEESGLAEKIYAAGYKIVYVPEASVTHRIPESRLVPEYIYARARMNGIMASYTLIRSSKRNSSKMILLGRSIGGFLRVGQKHLSSWLKPEWRIRCKADAERWKTFALHQFHVFHDPALKQHIYQEKYLSEG